MKYSEILKDETYRNKIKEEVDNFEKAIIFNTINTLQTAYYSDISKYKDYLAIFDKPDKSEEDYKILTNFVKNFHINCNNLQHIVGMIIVNNKITYIGNIVSNAVKKRNVIKFKPGKSFRYGKCYYVEPEVLEKLMANKDACDLNSDFYTEKQRRLIKKYILKDKDIEQMLNSCKNKDEKDLIRAIKEISDIIAQTNQLNNTLNNKFKNIMKKVNKNIET